MLYAKFIENFLTEEECSDIINIGLKTDIKRLTSVKRTGKNTYEDTRNEDKLHKRSGSYIESADIKNIEVLNNVATRTVELLNKLQPMKNSTYISVPKFTFNEYVGGDYLNYHYDMHEIEFGATVTVIYQLNDDYDDGFVTYKFSEKGEDHKVPKKTGSIFIFDSTLLHAVTELKGGKRYSMNSWPTFRILKKSLV